MEKHFKSKMKQKGIILKKLTTMEARDLKMVTMVLKMKINTGSTNKKKQIQTQI